MKEISEAEYHQHRDDLDGFCRHCNEFTEFGGTEPDAHDYLCEQCGEEELFGAEEALIMGFLDIS